MKRQSVKDYTKKRLKAIERITKVLDKALKLVSKGYYVEYIILLSQIIEHILGEIIHWYEKVINLSVFGEESFFRIPVSAKGKTLGNLKHLLEKYLNNNPNIKSIIKEVGRFNSCRKKAVHRLLESEQSLGEIEKEVKEYIQKNEPHILIRKLLWLWSEAQIEYWKVCIPKMNLRKEGEKEIMKLLSDQQKKHKKDFGIKK